MLLGRLWRWRLMRRFGRRDGLIFGKAIQEVLLRVDGKLIFRGHDQAMGRTWIGTEIAIATERHVDVKLCDPQFDRSTVRREHGSLFLRSLFRCHIDAVHRARAHTLAATDAVLDLIEEPHTRAFREQPLLVRILHGASPCEKMLPGNLHSKQYRPNRLQDVAEVLLHAELQWK